MIEGLISEAEEQALAGLASAGGLVVEIGSYLGKSTCALAGAGAQVYAVDIWDLRLPTEDLEKRRNKNKYRVNFESTKAFKTFQANLAAAGVSDRVVWIKAPSAEVAKAWNRPLDGLFIDGAHGYGSVKADHDGWARWVKPGGWIAFHDAQKANGGPRRVIREMSAEMWDGWRDVERLAIATRTEFGAAPSADDWERSAFA